MTLAGVIGISNVITVILSRFSPKIQEGGKSLGEKVKLPRDVVEAIDTIKRDLYSEWKKHVLRIAIATHCYFVTDPQAPIRIFADAGGLEDIIRALVHDYEVEQTPKDKVASYYNRLREGRSEVMSPAMACEYNVQMHTVKDVLNLLNIKIEGVND